MHRSQASIGRSPVKYESELRHAHRHDRPLDTPRIGRYQHRLLQVLVKHSIRCWLSCCAIGGADLGAAPFFEGRECCSLRHSVGMTELSWRTGRTAGLPRHTAPFNESRMRMSAKGRVHSGMECSPAQCRRAHSCKIRLAVLWHNSRHSLFIECSPSDRSERQCRSVRCSAVRCSAVRCSAVRTADVK
jgi:hypothetical protein